jgi:hypothetical protein
VEGVAGKGKGDCRAPGRRGRPSRRPGGRARRRLRSAKRVTK